MGGAILRLGPITALAQGGIKVPVRSKQQSAAKMPPGPALWQGLKDHLDIVQVIAAQLTTGNLGTPATLTTGHIGKAQPVVVRKIRIECDIQ